MPENNEYLKKYNDMLDTAVLFRARVGVSVGYKMIGKTTQLTIPLGAKDGLSVGDLGTVWRNREETAIIAIAELQGDRCVAQVVHRVGAKHHIKFGDYIEFIVMDNIDVDRIRNEVNRGK